MTDAGSPTLLQSRQLALKVGKWLAGAGRGEEALSLLAAWAACGPNDVDGQKLMAEALRLSPASPLAKQAFERMEGVAGDHSQLEAAIAYFNVDALAELAKLMPKPVSFRRAQVGFNNNIKYRGHTFHIQTEDSGLDRPHIITHLFADGGRIIKSHKRIYAAEVERADVAEYVRALMKGQQMEMAILLREKAFDEVIDGKRMGGMETLETPPRVEVKRMGGGDSAAVTTTAKRDKPKAVFRVQSQPSLDGPASSRRESVPPPKVVSAPPPAPVPGYIPAYQLSVERTAGGDPAVYKPTSDATVIGQSGEVTLPHERFCHAKEAKLTWRDDKLFLHDLPGGNGVFLRVQHLVELDAADEFIVGDQLLRVDTNPEQYDDAPTPEPTYFYSSPKWPSSFRLTQIFEGGLEGACVLARGSSIQVGSQIGDMLFPHDPLVVPQHCVVEEQAGVLILTDLDSRTGVFVRINGEQELMHGDELLVGRTRLKVEFLRRA